MTTAFASRRQALRLLMTVAPLPFALLSAGCGEQEPNQGQGQATSKTLDTTQFLVSVEDEPDTVDFQCTSIHYDIAMNAFNRLVDMKADEDGNVQVIPSLAESWEESSDGRTYTFHLRKGVTFSNGSPLTSSDVLYTFTRLLTHPDSCNKDIAENIVGAALLEAGETDTLEGIEVLSDLDFTITLEEPFEAFLACLSMPGASIMDEETMHDASDQFGKDPACTIGTGSFVLRDWEAGKGMVLTANEDCWEGAPNCAGLDLRFLSEPTEIRALFESGGLDVLDLDDLGASAEYFLHGDVYQDRLYEVQRIGICYVALNESVEPLDDVRVRKALQLALNRESLLDVVYSGRGSVENGIFPHGLYGYNPDLPEIPYDPDKARKLLEEAGYQDGFDLVFSVKSSSTQSEMSLAQTIVSMWKDVGVHASVEVIDEADFMSQRKSGELACYTAMWTADFDDPDNFVYTFFGNRENTTFRSLCYPNENVMERVRNARAIMDADARLQEYRDLERKIIQEDAAWIPLFSRTRTYVMSERIEGMQHSWNGSVKNRYRDITVKS